MTIVSKFFYSRKFYRPREQEPDVHDQELSRSFPRPRHPLAREGLPRLGRSSRKIRISHTDEREISGSGRELPILERRDQLPWSVLQARERVIERFRGTSHSGRSRLSTSQTVVPRWNGEGQVKAIRPLTPESIASLPQELYSPPFNCSPTASPEILLECCICLEPFHRGDNLLRLLCHHKFHSQCLIPWLRERGECPYCRSTIALVEPAAHLAAARI